jgi:oligogalacturonide lyase
MSDFVVSLSTAVKFIGTLTFFILQLTACATKEEISPPTTWIDSDTGHRVWRLSTEANSSSLYFTRNVFSADKTSMVLTTPRSINVLDLSSKNVSPVLNLTKDDRKSRIIEMGRITNALYFVREVVGSNKRRIISKNIYTGEETQYGELPSHYFPQSINAAETILVGTFEGPAKSGGRANSNKITAASKGELIYKRFIAKTQMSMFVMDLRTGITKVILSSTDWISNVQFSPTDPEAILYCHEGPWHEVDRLWRISADGTNKSKLHRRTMAMEIAGHEVWEADGKSVLYDWQYPKGSNFYLASVDTKTGERTAYLLERDTWSIHFAPSTDKFLFAGDGADVNQAAKSRNAHWIYLYKSDPKALPNGTSTPEYWQSKPLSTVRLVNMSAHDYRLEPNVRFSPDNKIVIFRANFFGYPELFGVETKKGNFVSSDAYSTPELARRFAVKKRALIVSEN